MLRRRALPVLIGAGLVLSASAGMAQAAAAHPMSTPGWRPVAQLGPPTGVTYPGAMIATSADDAWSTWGDCNPCGGSNPKQDFWLEHWTGRAWRRVSVPASIARFLPLVNGIAARSAHDLWMFTTGRAAHWNGKRWAIMKIPAWVVRFNLAGDVAITIGDFGPTNIWVFSQYQESFHATVPFAARYDGHRWTRSRLPGIPGQVNVLGPDDIWATAFPSSLKGREFLMHWNGKSWSTQPMPKPRDVPAKFSAQIWDLTAVGSRDVWLQEDVAKGLYTLRTQLFLHWNGRRWQTVSFRLPTSAVQFMAPDGHGGLWLSDVGEGRLQPRFIAHYSGGRWTRHRVPAPRGMGVQQLLSFTPIPGTRSLWADGGIYPLDTTTIVIGAIWKYGP